MTGDAIADRRLTINGRTANLFEVNCDGRGTATLRGTPHPYGSTRYQYRFGIIVGSLSRR